MDWLRLFLSRIGFREAKIVLSGKDIISKVPTRKGQAVAAVKTEKWFKTKYIVIDKNIEEISKMISEYDASKMRLP